MTSGVKLGDQVVSTFNEMKLRQSSRFLVLRVKDFAEVVVEKGAARTRDCRADWAAFVAALPRDDCRYGVFEFDFVKEGEGEGEGDRSRIVFVLWSPEGSKVKARVVYATAWKAVRAALLGIGHEVQANDAAGVDYDTILSDLQKSVK
eukprot:TRINITY_DN5193_c0_g1_i1.p1 TRINITY_DN5193_c0_g1~~TRINITY_DN5193_c0_g1_i1.p1  ORF type:complete len:148 (-),score=61.30 TRINITY_DN5193_c0_g1_i1:48-491(-)